MPRFLRCEFIDLDSLLAGRWREALDRLLQQPPPPERPRTDGADVVAEMIVARVLGRHAVERVTSSLRRAAHMRIDAMRRTS